MVLRSINDDLSDRRAEPQCLLHDGVNVRQLRKHVYAEHAIPHYFVHLLLSLVQLLGILDEIIVCKGERRTRRLMPGIIGYNQQMFQFGDKANRYLPCEQERGHLVPNIFVAQSLASLSVDASQHCVEKILIVGLRILFPVLDDLIAQLMHFANILLPFLLRSIVQLLLNFRSVGPLATFKKHICLI